jgi:hypothetical protein
MSQLTPSQKGAAAEAAITAAAIQLGLVVLRPLCEGGRYDLAIDLEPMLLRVQCKLAQRRAGVLSVRVGTSRYTPRGYVRTSYSADEIDAVAAYCPDLHRSFLIPIAEISGKHGSIYASRRPRTTKPTGSNGLTTMTLGARSGSSGAAQLEMCTI